MNERNFNAIPAAAMCFAGGEVMLGDNGEGTKTAPVKLKARSGKPIEHWFWGKVVHDLAGMRTHKPRLTIDYAHNDAEVLGYLNHFETDTGDLITSGALTPFKDDDRASEVLFKMRQGVPYEASIFFGGDGIKVEEVGEGMVSQVNGYQFEGPGIIIREWPLRGVAICPYGADQNTESASFAKGQTFAAAKIEQVKKEVTAMSETVAVEAKTEAEVKPVDAPVVEAEAKPESAIPEVKVAEQVDVAQAALTVERDGLKLEVTKLSESVQSLTSERDGLKVDRDGLAAKLAAAGAELTALKADRDEACRKLAAIMAGAPPVSAAPAPEVPAESAWKKAQKAAKRG
jgi:hypothetical protein